MALSLLLWPLGTGIAAMALILVPWGLGCFSGNSAQQARLGIAAPAFAPALMALNSSAIYLGQAAGASSGGWLIAHGGYAPLHWLGLAWMMAAIGTSVWAARRRAARDRMSDACRHRPRRRAGPRSNADLFITFTRLALQGFGGVLAVAQRELVEYRRWLTREQFVEMLAISQVLPGPNIVNLSLMLGDRYFGLRGALGALAGLLTVPLFIVLALATAYAEFASVPVVAGALRGMGAVAAGLVIATAVKLSGTLRTNRMGPLLGTGFALLTFLMIAWLRWPLAWVVVGLGAVAIAVAWHKEAR